MKLLKLACLLLFSSAAIAQGPPSLVGLMNSSDGVTWNDITTTSIIGAFPTTFKPSLVGILCYNTSTHQWVPDSCPPGGSGGGDTITSPGSTINVGGTTTNTTLDLNFTSANTWLDGMTIQDGLTVDDIDFTTAGVGMTFPGGSQIFEDSFTDLILQTPAVFAFSADIGLISGDLAQNDNTNSGSIFQIFGGTSGGQPVNTAIEVLNPDSYGMMVVSSGTHTLLNSANTQENGLGIGTVATGVPSAFAPSFAIGNNTSVLKGAMSYLPVVNTSAGGTPAILTNVDQSYTLSQNAVPTIASIYNGMRLTIQVCQPASGGPFTWTWPASFVGGQPPPTTASTCSQQVFDSFNGTTLVAENNESVSLTATATQTLAGSLALATIKSADGTTAATLSGGRWTYSGSGVASASTILLNGTIFTSGTGTTSFPAFFIQPTGATAVSTWATGGTFFGANAASGFNGSLVDLYNNNVHEFLVSAFGSANANHWGTISNCASSASPALCGASTMGAVAVAAGTNPTLVVDASGVTANSEIFLVEDQSLGTRLSVTCNTAALPTSTVVTARTAGTSFTFQVNGTFTTNPVCYNFAIYN